MREKPGNGDDYEPTSEPRPHIERIKVKLADGKEREIQNMISTVFIGPDGRPMTAHEFLTCLYGKIPEFFKNEDELREICTNPITRQHLLDR